MQDTALLQQLSDDIGLTRQLLELMDLEYQTLSERNLVELEKLLTQKQGLLALLGQHAARTHQAATKSSPRQTNLKGCWNIVVRPTSATAS